MSRYFGTDGIRGKANAGLNAETAYKVGRYLGYYYSREGRRKIVIGKDTRLSSDMLENALASGIAASGCDAYLVGFCPTPCVCYLTVNEDFACGAMISASHNPYYDNGIKIFSKEGVKLQGEVEELIEDYLDGKVDVPYATDDAIGRVISYPQGLENYLDWIVEEYPLDLSGMKIAMDCANGSSSFTAERTLKRLGAEVNVFNAQPDGININSHCGSTPPEGFISFMKEHEGEYDLGLTFDGDADRQIPIAPDGRQVDGDYMLYILGKYYRDAGVLEGNTVVTTVMANLGLWKAMEREGIHVEKTDGEQSGHIILKRHVTTGDGLMTALSILKVMKVSGKSVQELMEGLKIYPQLLVNVRVTDKTKVMDDPQVKAAVSDVDVQLHGNGRVLVRPSGTEPLLRVMAEAETDEICHEVCHRIADLIQEKYGA